MTVIVFEDSGFRTLLPLTYWRPVFELRCGRLSLLEKIRQRKGMQHPIVFVRPELADIVQEHSELQVNPDLRELKGEVLLVNGRWLADGDLPELEPDSYLYKGEAVAAARLSEPMARLLTSNVLAHQDLRRTVFSTLKAVAAGPEIKLVNYPWDLIVQNPAELLRECNDGAKGAGVHSAVHLIGEKAIHIGESCRIMPGVVIDAEEGPVWIDDRVKIGANAVIQGPCCIGPGSVVQPMAIIRENTSIGRVCKVGGEIDACIIHGYSNKQHHGFLGHSYVGEWVNIGAGSVSSDLKNTYGKITTSLDGHDEINTGLMFLGLVIGDHSKVGINVCFGSGSVVGTCTSVILSHIPPKFVGSFRWLTDQVQTDYDAAQAAEVARRMMARRNLTLSDSVARFFQALPEIVKKYERRQTASA